MRPMFASNCFPWLMQIFLGRTCSWHSALVSLRRRSTLMEVNMRRNAELLKEILSFMEDHENPTQCCKDIEKGVSAKKGHTWPEVRLHLALLKDMGLVTECATAAEYRLTSIGYDVIESVDPVERMKQWTWATVSANVGTASSFVSAKHPLPPAARSQRFS
jgi:hypothetical protein